jgi:CDGSH-type Zn-finger protein
METNLEPKNNLETKVEVKPNGPLIVLGNLSIKDVEGNVTSKSNMTAFCRCGASSNKPFCDGSHRKIDFKESQ